MNIGSVFINALPWLQAGLGLASTFRAFKGARGVARQGVLNARMYEEEAAATWRAYEDRAAILRRGQRLFLATQRTNYLKSGVVLEGTPMLVLKDMISQQHEDQIALYHGAKAEFRKQSNLGAIAAWQGYQQSDAIRNEAISNFGASLLSERISYPVPWTRRDDDAVAKSAGVAPAPRYTRAQANAVPGARGWRPFA